MDLDLWEERAAVLEFDEGMSRFEAETEAARRQGFKRHEVLNAVRQRDSERGGNNRRAALRDAADNLPRVQSPAAEGKGPLPKRDVQGGWNRLVLPSL